MAKPKGVNQKAKWRAHSIRLAEYASRVQSVYDTLNDEIAKTVVRTGYDGTAPFRFADYPLTKKKFEEVQASFVRDLRSLIYSGTSEEWKQSNLVQDLLADKVLKFYGAKERGKKHRVYYQANNDALKAFQQRKEDGMGLSERLWNQSKDYKEEMEHAISSAIEKGTSAVKLSKRLSKYLQDFPSLKHDYKEKFGKAVTCQDCEYRSIRLARSEINMAYRTAEQERWKQFDFVLGYEVKLTQNGRHVPDICDDLAGKYPKDFVFKGWHPNCMCYVIPILKTEEQFWNDEDVSEIIEPPKNFTDWLEANAERIDKAAENGTLPYWYTDNAKYVKVSQKESWSMNNEIREELIQRGFRKRGMITVDEYNSSCMAGFDILHFDKQFESIFDDYSVRLSTKELKDAYDRKVSLRYKGYTQSNEEIEYSRYFRYEKVDGKEVPVVDHKLFVLPKELQGKGISKRVFREQLLQYEKAGIYRVYIHANIDVGGLCWAKYGTLAERNDIDFIAKVALKGGKITSEEYAEISTYLSKFKGMVPMQDLAYAPYGERLLLGTSWHGYIDLKDKAQLEYLHRYLGM